MPRRRKAVLTVRENEALPRGVSFRPTSTTPWSARKTVDRAHECCAQRWMLFNWSSLIGGSTQRNAFDTRIMFDVWQDIVLMLQDFLSTMQDARPISHDGSE